MATTAHTSPTTDLERAILDRLRPGLHQHLRLLSRAQVAEVDPGWMADVMLNALPTQHPFAELGPFYDTAGVTGWLGISRQALHQKVKTHQVLACTTGERQRVYPAWQFSTDGRPILGLPQILRVLLPATDPWTAAIWLTTPADRLDDLSAIEWLTSRRDLAQVLGAAREDAARWAR